MAELRWGSATDAGRLRPENEDSLFAAAGLYVVADGMGGHEAGEVASQLAVDRINGDLLGPDLPTADEVVESIGNANRDIFRAAIATPGHHGMGTTVTAIAVIADAMAGRAGPNVDLHDPHKSDVATEEETEPELPPDVTPVIPAEPSEALLLANVGDSRTYLFRHGKMRPVTVDHSYVQELVNTGHITTDEARLHPRRNIVTRALGIEPDVKIDWWTLPLIRGDRFLLCSDGLVDEVHDDEITTTLQEEEDPQVAAEKLVAQANDAGGRDNISVIVVDILDGDDPPDPTVEVDIVPVWPEEGTEPTPAGTIEVDADPDTDTDLAAAAAAGAAPKRKRRLGIKRAVILFVIAALLVVLFVFTASWARSGYFVEFDEDDEAIIWKGQTDGFLWFDPTRETPAGPERDELTEESVDAVEERPRFDSRSDADEFIRSLELESTEDDVPDDEAATSTTTTSPSTTVAEDDDTTTTETTAPES